MSASAHNFAYIFGKRIPGVKENVMTKEQLQEIKERYARTVKDSMRHGLEEAIAYERGEIDAKETTIKSSDDDLMRKVKYSADHLDMAKLHEIAGVS